VQIVELLRARIFALTAQELELDPVTCPNPWGVITEIGYASEVVTLVVLADGSVSVYLHSGKGRIGCGLHPEVRAAGMRMLNLAQGITASTSDVPQRPYVAPSGGHVRFYFHTAAGLRSADASKAQLDEGAIDIAELYHAGHTVIGLIESTGAGQPVADAIKDAAASVRSHAAANRAAPPAKGKLCRILPYAGAVVRRSRR
jgi:hypothetical protein